MYKVAAQIFGGMTLVVTPLVALAREQAHVCSQAGIYAYRLGSENNDPAADKNACWQRSDRYKF